MQDAKETLEGRFGLENLIGRPSAEAKQTGLVRAWLAAFPPFRAVSDQICGGSY